MSVFRHLKPTAAISYTQTLVEPEGPRGWHIVTGPRGTIRAWDIGWVPDHYYREYPDRLAELYDSLCAVVDGHYHCCLTGKCWLA
jgi:hypothetical protein